MMKRSLIAFTITAAILSGCAAVQSIVRSTFPYTATLIVPSTGALDSTLSVSSQASSFDQVLMGQGSNTNAVKDVRMSSARLEATSPAGQNMGVFKTIRLYISRGGSSSEVLIASREDIGTSIGNNIMLDIDNSQVLDEYIKGSTVRVRMEYVLRMPLTADVSLKSSIGFSVAPDTAK
jgi:hypothetical protein